MRCRTHMFQRLSKRGAMSILLPRRFFECLVLTLLAQAGDTELHATFVVAELFVFIYLLRAERAEALFLAFHLRWEDGF